MSMSRKDFEALAAVVRDFHGYDDLAELAPAWISERLADVCQLNGPGFDRQRFLAACEPCVPVPTRPAVTSADSGLGTSYSVECLDDCWGVCERWNVSGDILRFAPFDSRESAESGLRGVLEGDGDIYTWWVGTSQNVYRAPSDRFVYGLVSMSGGNLFGVVDRESEWIATWGCSEHSQHSASEREVMRACLDASRGSGAMASGFYWEPFDSLLRVFPDSVMDR